MVERGAIGTQEVGGERAAGSVRQVVLQHDVNLEPSPRRKGGALGRRRRQDDQAVARGLGGRRVAAAPARQQEGPQGGQQEDGSRQGRAAATDVTLVTLLADHAPSLGSDLANLKRIL